MELKACIKCGSTRLHIPTVHDSTTKFGITIPGASELSGIMICDECQQVGIPIIFKSEEEYKKFVRALKK